MTARNVRFGFVLTALAAAIAACSGEETSAEKTYEYRPPWDAGSGGGDASPSEDANPPDSATEADSSGPDDASETDAHDAGNRLPPIACNDDTICLSLLVELTGPCVEARCAEGLCALITRAEGAPCDDGLACTADDRCGGSVCGGIEVVCDDGDPCTVDVCSPLTGACESTPLDGPEFVCDDGKACTNGDHCAGSGCAGSVISCDDGASCTVDNCDPATGLCAHQGGPMEGKACDDKSLCTTGETCHAGICRAPEKDCDDGLPCTADSCLPATGGCTHGYSPAIDGLACSDGDACTVDDVCALGDCLGLPKPCPAGSCEVAACEAGTGQCLPPTPAPFGTPCEDGTACTLGDTCDGAACVGVVVPCDDGNPCTADVCVAQEGCSSTPLADAANCDDGDLCTAGDACAAGVCKADPVSCDDGNPCTFDGCDSATGTCTAASGPLEGAACAGDSDLCTSGGTCVSGLCGGEGPTDCDDENPCTTDGCDAATGECTTALLADGSACADGQICTGPDHCTLGACSGTTRTCDDGNECTHDSCNPEIGCLHAAVSGCEKPLHPCNVSSARSTTNVAVTACVCAIDATCCSASWGPGCVASAQASCGLSCGACDAMPVACKLDADCGFCDADGDACTGGWRCDAGKCKATPPVTCDAAGDIGCVRTRCNPSNGECARAPRPDLCADGKACTTDECNASGTCATIPRPSCGEQHPCEASLTGGSLDADVTSCVCAEDPSCCTTAWTAACVAIARATCDVVCDCATLPPSATACASGSDCRKCDDDILCNGGWRCDDGHCTATGPVDCSTRGCLAGACDEATGTCTLAPITTACDDGDGCTTDACLANGACVHHAVPGCGIQPPCETSALARSSDDAITACVCERVPECCAEAWTSACVVAAHFACGAPCGCAAEARSCTHNADCASCDDQNACNGGWICDSGTCSTTPAVTCDATGDRGCVRNTCLPSTGICTLAPYHAACDDGLPCTQDFCEGGEGQCFHAQSPLCGTNHPCQASPLPESSDPETTTCVCALDVSCCTDEWSDACVALAISACGQTCDCTTLPVAAKSCSDTSDCWVCNERPCTGAWTCQAGQCVTSGAVACSPTDNRGCVQSRCSEATGSCELTAQNAACPDLGCLGGLCNYTSGKCGVEIIPGCVAPVDLCDPASLPATNGDPVADCVCSFDPSCCGAASGGVWDQRCADEAVQLCGLKCGCDALRPAQLACSSDADCGGCDADADRCNGTWRCVGLVCVAAAPVQCGATGAGCNAVSCDPASGECVAGGDPARCDDQDPCTIDSCSAAAGTCGHTPIPGCGANSPCTVAATPGSKNAAVTACVCALAPECCTEAWTPVCVSLGQKACGLACEPCPPGGCVGSLDAVCPTIGCTGTDSAAMLCALDICFPGLGVEAGLGVSSPTNSPLDGAFGALEHYGDAMNGLSPRAGPSYLVLATGGLDTRPHSEVRGGDGTPDPWSTSASATTIFDAVDAVISLKAPAGVTGFSIDSLFLSVEFHEYVGSNFIDAFYIVLTAPVTTAGASVIINAAACAAPETHTDFTDSGTPRCYTGVNSAFAEPCDGAGTNLAGTGFECGGAEAEGGSATGWLRTTWPITPGESFTLRFHIHDAVDGSFDSATIVDRFRWLTGPVTAGTVKPAL